MTRTNREEYTIFFALLGTGRDLCSESVFASKGVLFFSRHGGDLWTDSLSKFSNMFPKCVPEHVPERGTCFRNVFMNTFRKHVPRSGTCSGTHFGNMFENFDKESVHKSPPCLEKKRTPFDANTDSLHKSLPVPRRAKKIVYSSRFVRVILAQGPC